MDWNIKAFVLLFLWSWIKIVIKCISAHIFLHHTLFIHLLYAVLSVICVLHISSAKSHSESTVLFCLGIFQVFDTREILRELTMKNSMMYVTKLHSELWYEMLVEDYILCFSVDRIKAYCCTVGEKKEFIVRIQNSLLRLRYTKNCSLILLGSCIFFLELVNVKVLLQQDWNTDLPSATSEVLRKGREKCKDASF